MALVWALGSGQLTVEPPPPGFAVALPVHTDAIVGTCRIQTVHCSGPRTQQEDGGRRTKDERGEKKQTVDETKVK